MKNGGLNTIGILLKEDDLLVAISSSGNSQNTVNAIKMLKRKM